MVKGCDIMEDMQIIMKCAKESSDVEEFVKCVYKTDEFVFFDILNSCIGRIRYMKDWYEFLEDNGLKECW